MSDIAKAYVQIVPSAKGIKGSISHVLGGEADARILLSLLEWKLHEDSVAVIKAV